MGKPTQANLIQSTLMSRGDELYHLVKRYRAETYQLVTGQDLAAVPELAEIDAALTSWEAATAKVRPPVMADKLPEANNVRIEVRRAATEPDPEAATTALLEQLSRQQQRIELKR